MLLNRRARLVNYIKTSEVIRQSYPLQIRSSGPHTYFMKRETWGWTDFLMNPMVRSYNCFFQMHVDGLHSLEINQLLFILCLLIL